MEDLLCPQQSSRSSVILRLADWLSWFQYVSMKMVMRHICHSHPCKMRNMESWIDGHINPYEWFDDHAQIRVCNPTFDSTLAWTQRSIMTQPRTLVVGSVHLKLWRLNTVKVKTRPGPTIGAPQELVYDKNMHHAHNCSVARINPKGSGNQNRKGRVRNRKARPNVQVRK